MWTIDFESEGIVGNPIKYPPRPIGVSIKRDNGPSIYYTGEAMKQQLAPIFDSGEEMVFQNAPFDLRIAEEHLGLMRPHWSRVHDTQFLIYLYDPHARSVSLKPSGERILGIKPDAQDELREWILDNVKEASTKTWGAYICRAPVPLVAKYARQDTDLTWELFVYLISRVPKEPYDTERQLSMLMTRASQTGIRVDMENLERDYETTLGEQKRCHQEIFTRLGCEFEITKGEQLADALEAAGQVTEWVLTPKSGKRSTSRENLISVVKDPSLATLLSYSGALQTVLGTFMKSWIQLATCSAGRLYPSWNQVRNDNDKGTRTGRLSCSEPNLQNVPKPYEFAMPEGYPQIPDMRDYLLPEPGQEWNSRDFSSQEMRLLAHFEDGVLLEGFRKDPGLDPHEFIQWMIREMTGTELSRKHVKGISFGMIYGMGVPGLSKQLNIDVVECDRIVNAYHMALPGVRKLQRATKHRGKVGEAIKTIGGRLYYAEPAIITPTSKREFYYKLLNYLIQGSAADQTKRALISYLTHKPAEEEFICTVHDEINISIDPGADDWCLRQAMEEYAAIGLDVPMRTTRETGTNWGNIK